MHMHTHSAAGLWWQHSTFRPPTWTSFALTIGWPRGRTFCCCCWKSPFFDPADLLGKSAHQPVAMQNACGWALPCRRATCTTSVSCAKTCAHRIRSLSSARRSVPFPELSVGRVCYVGCLKGVSQSVQILFNGINAVIMVLNLGCHMPYTIYYTLYTIYHILATIYYIVYIDFDNPEIARPFK